MVPRQPNDAMARSKIGRPDEAGEIAAARDQRQRRAAAAVEPAADIDIERRVEAGIAEQAHEQAVAEPELPRLRPVSRSTSPTQIIVEPKITVQRMP